MLVGSCAQVHQSERGSTWCPRPISTWNPAVATPHWNRSGKSRAEALAANASRRRTASPRVRTPESLTDDGVVAARVEAMPAVSVLDLSPVPAGEPEAQALRNTLDLAQLA